MPVTQFRQISREKKAMFGNSFSISSRVVNALILRELNSRYGNSRLGYLWAIANPIISIMVLFFLFSTIRSRETGDIPILMFLVTGWFSYGYYQTMVSSIANGEAANRSLMMHQPVTRLDVMASRAVVETLTTVSFFVVGVAIAAIIEDATLPNDPILVLASFAAAGTFGLSLGLAMGAILTYFPFAMNFLQPVNRIGFFVSGVLFTATMLPSWLYPYIRWNPMLHPIEGIRQGWFEVYTSPVLDLTYTFSIALPLLAVGLYLERRTRRGIKFS
ncbi:ABC transporter permease [Parvularcula sp. ZS-1/3]|uniref:Transport permease protein n=1 Tax=Parvularcula mediterranea TaxID=2732508 RepID=A0A7Y3W5M0_9PROT|nr:ABC transporter permease [Parvularcula mediterranea]NNU16764.1 ABC transporter permease [Parvularcula mediterranea]